MPTADTSETAFRQALGRVIAMRRAELGLKRNDLRDRSQLSYPYVAELENGTKRPSQAALSAIATALELRPSELLERAEALVSGEDLMRPSPMRSEPSWFHTPTVAPMAAAPSRDEPEARGRSPRLASLLPEEMQVAVREIVREELERLGVVAKPRRRR